MKSIQAIKAIVSCGIGVVCIFNVYHSSLLVGQVGTETSQAAQTLLEDFRSGKPSLDPPNSNPPRTATVDISSISSNTNATPATNITSNTNTTLSTCIPFINNLASDFQRTTEYKQSTKLPVWMKEYFDWHREQTSQMDSCNFDQHQYLILRCTTDDKRCGGLSDRLKSIPMFVALAAKFRRIFLIRWNRPTPLEAFLLPHEVDWSVPDWMHQTDLFRNDTMVRKRGKRLVNALQGEASTVTFVEGFVQDMWGGSYIYHRFDSELDANKSFDPNEDKKTGDSLGWAKYEVIFRDLFYTLFKPTPEVAKLIQTRMESANLMPGNFSTSHYRAFYAIEDDKGARTQDELYNKTKNAIHCATKQQPGAPIYFASDSQLAVAYARNLSKAKGHSIVALDQDQEALHLDKRTSGNPSDFYPTFVDLLIMGQARCMSHGVGGFGLFANLLSKDPTCVIKHDAKVETNMETCEWTDP